MSTPPYLRLPPGTRTGLLRTARGALAALDLRPSGAADPPTVLLVPGLTGSKEDFIAVLAPLAAAGYRAVALDQRGQHESPHATDPARYAVTELAADLLALVDALEAGPVHLVGHSFGGLVARAAVIASPRRFRSLTLMGSGPAGLPEASAGNLRLLLQALPALDLATIWGVAVELGEEAGTALPEPEIAEFLRRRFLANAPAGLDRMGRELLTEPDRVAELRAAGVPVLVTHGEGDSSWPPATQREMARLLDACYTVVKGAAHSPAAEAPEDTTRVMIEYWAGLGQAAVGGSRSSASPSQGRREG